MRILILCDSMRLGGAETHVLSLAKGLCSDGHSVTVAADYGELVPRLIKECGKRLDFVRLAAKDRGVLSFIRYLIGLHEVIKSFRPDVIHAHSRMTAFCVRLLRKMTPLPFFGFCVTAHAMYPKSLTMRLLSTWGDRCIAVSEDIKSNLIENYRVECERITVIPNGVDTNPVLSDDERRGDGEVLLFVSRLDRDTSHGAYCICEAAKRLLPFYPKLKIRIVGGGEELSQIRSVAERIPSVEIIGGRSELTDIYRSASLVIGVSRVALEGMVAGKNVILFGNEGALGLLEGDRFRDAEKTNFTCRGFGVKDEEFLYNEIKRFFETPESTREEMARENRLYVKKYHSSQMMIGRTESIYRRIVTSPVKITVGGYYGFGNMGDEALLSTLADRITEIDPESEISTLYNGKLNRRGVISVNRFSPLAVCGSLLRSDIFILGGGSLLQNETSGRSLVYYCLLIIAAKLFHCRCILLSNGVGPINGDVWRRLAAFALTLADGVSVRDRASADLVLEITSGRVVPDVSSDLCFLSSGECEEDERVSDIKRLIHGDYAVVALKGNGSSDPSDVKIALKANGLFPVFVAMDEGRDRAKAHNGSLICDGVFADGLSPKTLLGLIRGAKIVVGERLHALIFASMVGVRFVPLGDAVKVRSFFEENAGISFSCEGDLNENVKAVLSMPRSFFDASDSRRRALVSAHMLNESIRKAKKSKNAKKIIKSS